MSWSSRQLSLGDHVVSFQKFHVHACASERMYVHHMHTGARVGQKTMLDPLLEWVFGTVALAQPTQGRTPGENSCSLPDSGEKVWISGPLRKKVIKV